MDDGARIKQAIEKYGPVKSRFILRLGKEDGKFEPWHLGPEAQELDFETFLACLHLYRLNKQVDQRMRDQKKLKTFYKREAKKAAKPPKAVKKKKGGQ